MRSAVNFKIRTLLVFLGRVINEHLRINTSINLESLYTPGVYLESLYMPQYSGWAKCLHKKKIYIFRQIDSLEISSFSNIITETIKLQDAAIQKL